MQIATAESWYETRLLDDGVAHVWEPHIGSFYRCNIWHVRGRDRDLLVDSGMMANALSFADTALGAGYRELDRMLAEQVSDLCRALQRDRRMPRRIDCDDAGQVLFFVCNSLFMEFVADDAMPLARMKDRMFRQVRLLFGGLHD